ncbi:hypothetical protein Acid7E03_44580 [Acidisoma sp. 7E03]
MFDARTRGANIESVVPKQPRRPDGPAKADQRDGADNGYERGATDCRSPGKARILRGV